jgi:hypothetical protein
MDLILGGDVDDGVLTEAGGGGPLASNRRPTATASLPESPE